MINAYHRLIHKLLKRNYVTILYAEEYRTYRARIIKGKLIIKFSGWRSYQNEPIIEMLGIQKKQFKGEE